MKKSFWIFQNGGFFPINSLLFFSKNSAFANISWFSDRVWKFIFSSESSFFCSSSGSEDIREKHMFQKQLDVFFCYSLYVSCTNLFFQLPLGVYICKEKLYIKHPNEFSSTLNQLNDILLFDKYDRSKE